MWGGGICGGMCSVCISVCPQKHKCGCVSSLWIESTLSPEVSFRRKTRGAWPTFLSGLGGYCSLVSLRAVVPSPPLRDLTLFYQMTEVFCGIWWQAFLVCHWQRETERPGTSVGSTLVTLESYTALRGWNENGKKRRGDWKMAPEQLAKHLGKCRRISSQSEAREGRCEQNTEFSSCEGEDG